MTELINKSIDYIIELLLFIRPDALLDVKIMANIDTYAEYAFDILKKVNFLVPVPNIFIVLVFMISFKAIILGIWFVNWVIKRIFDVIP